MSQLALARRYRPRTFQALVGQEVTVQALTNALESQRLHHAYLFTGTRGVGKTSIARILAKCLNCEKKISPNPCGECRACIAIDEGRFVDLIEVDAASRTKVEDTRDLLDNVQYLPSQGRFKIYLIDEVHMLSTHSFNALLKTLEEPPSHVKFLLATTDPQKLPMTVLSRCLQFHLHRLSIDKIIFCLSDILHKESCRFEPEALKEIARAADGSLRDALSLLDQALSFGNGSIETGAVRKVLGIPDRNRLLALLKAVVMGNSRLVLQEINGLENTISDFSALLTELLTLIHQMAIAHILPEAIDEHVFGREAIIDLATNVSAEEVQLYYQIGLQGYRDLPFAPSPRMGFEMTLLRMVAFQPVKIVPQELISKEVSVHSAIATASVAKREAIQKSTEDGLLRPLKGSHNDEDKQDIKEKKEKMEEYPAWHILVEKLNLSGLSKMLAEHCTVASFKSETVHLILEEAQKPLLTKRHEDRLKEALREYLGKDFHLKMTVGKVVEETPAIHHRKRLIETEKATHQAVEGDTKIQQLIQAFDAKIEHILLKDNQSVE